MMKLMSDLIAYLRDLLVCKVKPDALADELSPELQKSLRSQAAMIETDRLLELIEQFAAAEGRMKWAPNKKLHFEVAVIKAIQTLSQVTLDRSDRKSGRAARTVKRRRQTAAPVAYGAPKSRQPARRPRGDRRGEGARRRVAEERARRRQASESTDIRRVWRQAVRVAYARRPLIKQLDRAPPDCSGPDGPHFSARVCARQKTTMESLSRPTNRNFLEALLKELTGQNGR